MRIARMRQMNKFEQVFSDAHQMSLAGGGRGRAWTEVNASCIMGNGHMVTPMWTDRHEWKYYLPETSLAGGNNEYGKIEFCKNENNANHPLKFSVV